MGVQRVAKANPPQHQYDLLEMSAGRVASCDPDQHSSMFMDACGYTALDMAGRISLYASPQSSVQSHALHTLLLTEGEAMRHGQATTRRWLRFLPLT